MIKSTLAIFVLFAICDFTLAHYYGSGPYCGYESNVNYATYPENIIQTFNFSSVTDCCRRCSENPACQAWTLNKDQVIIIFKFTIPTSIFLQQKIAYPHLRLFFGKKIDVGTLAKI